MDRDMWIARAIAYCVSIGMDANEARLFCEPVYDGVTDEDRGDSTPEEYIREELSYCTDDGV